MSITSVAQNLVNAGKPGLPLVASDEQSYKAEQAASKAMTPGKPGLPIVASGKPGLPIVASGKPGLPLVASDEIRFKAELAQKAQVKDTADKTKEKNGYDIDWISYVFASAIV